MLPKTLDSVVVVGGCGFLGYEIVRLLTKESECSITVLSRDPSEPRVDGVPYRACDITNIDSLRTMVLEIQPHVVIHSASPVSTKQD